MDSPAESKGFFGSLGSSISGPKFVEFDEVRNELSHPLLQADPLPAVLRHSSANPRRLRDTTPSSPRLPDERRQSPHDAPDVARRAPVRSSSAIAVRPLRSATRRARASGFGSAAAAGAQRAAEHQRGADWGLYERRGGVCSTVRECEGSSSFAMVLRTG